MEEAVVRGSEVADVEVVGATASLIEADVCFDKFFPAAAEDVASESLVSNEMSTRLKCKNWDSGFGGICSFLGVSTEESSDWAKQSQDLENEIKIANMLIRSYSITGFEVFIMIFSYERTIR